MSRGIDVLDMEILSIAARHGIEKMRRGWAPDWRGPYWHPRRIEGLVKNGLMSGINGVASRHLYTTREGLQKLEEASAKMAKVDQLMQEMEGLKL